MIDVHSHILPGVDDGAASMKESLQMLSIARRQGITDVFATSHYSRAFPNKNPEKLRQLRDELMRRANRPVKGPDGKVKHRQPIQIWTGQEIFYSNSVIIGRQQLRVDRVYASGTLFRDLYCSTEFVKDEICPSDRTCRKVSMSQKREKIRRTDRVRRIDSDELQICWRQLA